MSEYTTTRNNAQYRASYRVETRIAFGPHAPSRYVVRCPDGLLMRTDLGLVWHRESRALAEREAALANSRFMAATGASGAPK